MWTTQKIREWQIATFGEGAVDVYLKRSVMEFAELLVCPHSKIPEEIADVVIVLSGLLGVLKHDLQEEVDKKMEINIKRKWKLNNDGTGQHIQRNNPLGRQKTRTIQKARPSARLLRRLQDT
jgi:hypothetical protein